MCVKFIEESFSNYYNNFPNNTLKTAVLSGIFGYSFALLRTNNLKVANQFACLSAVAASVHSLTAPLFSYLFNKKDISWGQSLIVMTANFAITKSVLGRFKMAAPITAGRAVLSMALCVYLFNRELKMNLAESQPYYII